MSHLMGCTRAVPRWPALAVVGLLAGLLGPPSTPGPPGRPTPHPTLPATQQPTPTSAPATTPAPATAPTTNGRTTTPGWPTPSTATPQRIPPRWPAPRPTPTPAAVVVDGGQPPIHAGWTSYLPAPETGLKIFAAGLLGLVVAITGLATLAIRRRNS